MGLSNRALCFPRSRQIDTHGTQEGSRTSTHGPGPHRLHYQKQPHESSHFLLHPGLFTCVINQHKSSPTHAQPLDNVPFFHFSLFLIKLKTVILTQISIYSVLQKSKGKRKKETNKRSYLAQLCEPFVLSTCRNSLPSCTSTILTIYVLMQNCKQ